MDLSFTRDNICPPGGASSLRLPIAGQTGLSAGG
jgi:hypothetical protein